jgi:hypothetical protein
VRIDRVWLRGEPTPTDFHSLVRVYHPGDLAAGWRRHDRVQFLARISLPRGFRNRGTLPAAIYYWNRNTVCLASCKTPALFTRVHGGVEGPSDRLYRHLAGRIREIAGFRGTSEVLEALLLGRNVTSPDLRNAYIDAGCITSGHQRIPPDAAGPVFGGLPAAARLPSRWRPWS